MASPAFSVASPGKRGPSIPEGFCQQRSVPAQFVFTGSPLSRGRQQCALFSSGSSLMDALPECEFLHPQSVEEMLKARAAHPDARLLGGGTDLMVNIRRGIVAPLVLIDMTGVAELRAIKANAHALEIGASVTLSELASH